MSVPENIGLPDNIQVTKKEITLDNGETQLLSWCAGERDCNVATVLNLGDYFTRVTYCPSKLRKGVNIKAIRAFNESTVSAANKRVCTSSDEHKKTKNSKIPVNQLVHQTCKNPAAPVNAPCKDNVQSSQTTKHNSKSSAENGKPKNGKSESERSALSRARREFMNLSLSNSEIWKYTVTITLDEKKWPRDRQYEFAQTFKNEAKAWRRLSVNGQQQCKNFSYLLGLHLNTETERCHFHGFTDSFPDNELIPYTMEDLKTEALPDYIRDKICCKIPIFHIKRWDYLYGYNMVMQINSPLDILYYTLYIIKKLPPSLNPSDKGLLMTKRYFHSRNLRKAEVIAEYQINNAPQAFNEYDEYLEAIAMPKGYYSKMHYKIYHDDPKTGKKYMVGLDTLVDPELKSPSDTISYMDEKFLRLDNREYA